MKKAAVLFASFACFSFASNQLSAGPKGTISVPRISRPITIDGDFSDWPLARYTTMAQQPTFPDAQGIGIPTGANGDHLVWDVTRVGPFNGTDLEIWEPDNASEFGSSIYLAYDDKFLYVLGVFIDDELNGVRAEDGLTNFFNDGFEFYIDAFGDSDDLIAEFGFPSIDTEEPNTDDFQLTFGLNDSFEPAQPQPNDVGAEIHMERAGNVDIIKALYLDVRDATDFSSVGGRDVAAKSYDDLAAAGAQNPEVLANPDETFTGYAAELVLPFGFIDGFTPDHNMGFALFWRDVDDHEDPQPGFGGGNIFWTDWSQNTTTSGPGEDGNLYHGGNWGELQFVGGLEPFDLNGDGTTGVDDIDALTQEIRSGGDNAIFDLDGNGTVDTGDLSVLIGNGLNTYLGDSNLDGEFNSSDFVVVFGSGQYEDGVPLNSTWATGDWNADGEFNSSDLVAAFTQGGYERGPRGAVAFVPEPNAIATVVIGLIGMFGCVRVRSQI